MEDAPPERPMGTRKLHPDEVDIDIDLVARLVAARFPDLRDEPVRAFRSTGTVNAIYRLGEHRYARMPLTASSERALLRECTWLPELAPHLTLRVPEPERLGDPEGGYPFRWAVYGWIDGEPFADDRVDDERSAASDLAGFVRELRSVEPTEDAPRGGRRPLAELDDITREAIVASSDLIDREAAMAAWGRALDAPVWDGSPVWIHTDLLRPNLLVRDGRLHAVIDFGGAGVGDPAADVIAAWSVFDGSARELFGRSLEVDDGTYERARGYALHQAALIIPYYRVTNPAFVEMAVRTVREVLADTRSSG